MGSEARCTAHSLLGTSVGKALLETDELIFRGDFRLAIPYRAMRSVRAEGGELVVELADETVRLELGPVAARWAEKIANPRTRSQKLGLEPGQRVSLVALDDEAFQAEVRAVVVDVSVGRAKRGSDLVFVGIESRADLRRLATLARALEPDGALWTIRPKGRPEPSEAQVAEAAHAAGLVDVKVVRFSATHTAEKFVIPVARRGK